MTKNFNLLSVGLALVPFWRCRPVSALSLRVCAPYACLLSISLIVQKTSTDPKRKHMTNFSRALANSRNIHLLTLSTPGQPKSNSSDLDGIRFPPRRHNWLCTTSFHERLRPKVTVFILGADTFARVLATWQSESQTFCTTQEGYQLRLQARSSPAAPPRTPTPTPTTLAWRRCLLFLRRSKSLKSVSNFCEISRESESRLGSTVASDRSLSRRHPFF